MAFVSTGAMFKHWWGGGGWVSQESSYDARGPVPWPVEVKVPVGLSPVAARNEEGEGSETRMGCVGVNVPQISLPLCLHHRVLVLTCLFAPIVWAPSPRS